MPAERHARAERGPDHSPAVPARDRLPKVLRLPQRARGQGQRVPGPDRLQRRHDEVRRPRQRARVVSDGNQKKKKEKKKKKNNGWPCSSNDNDM